MAKAVKVEQVENGKWKVGNLEFASEEAAMLFVTSRNEGPTFWQEFMATKGGKWSLAIFIIIALAAFVSMLNPSAPRLNGVTQFGKSEALTKCQMAVKMFSRDAEKAVVPYVDGYEISSGYGFAWNNTTKLARLRNGFGLEVGTTAICNVNTKTKQITSLTIDGKKVI